MVVKGGVEVESLKTGKTLARVGMKVYPGDKVSTQKEARAKVVMSDRNVMNISPETVLTINKYENDPKSNTKNVELELTQGKVRNNVEQKYDGDKSKFIIKTPTAVAGVRGTQFLTSFDRTTQITAVITFKGAVQMAPILPNGQVSSQVVTIKKGETSSVKQGQDSPEPPKIVPKEDLNKAEKESQAKVPPKPENESTAVADQKSDGKGDGGEKKDTKLDDKNRKDKDVKKNEISDQANVNSEGKREPASDIKPGAIDKVKESVMIDKKDLDFRDANNIKPPMVVDVPTILPVVTRPPTIIPPAQQNPMIDEIVRSRINKTTVIIRPVIPNK